ncbi:protein JINGUBANG-like [Rhodamnia argentea]|uniref:Protein JINGUBANG-like n=1 Tax=Rhodamnia argentea TaxID=178133 RepID=A0A8B8Q9U3_9MYRT|nr:protein JINGUBANG-like [Rhodamnia argentea]
MASMNNLIIPPPTTLGSPWTLSPLRTPSPSLLYTCIASLHRPEGQIHAVAVSKDLVFTGSDSCRIRAWRKPDCTERGCLKAGSGEVLSMLAHGDMLFSSHEDHKIRTWNISASDDFLSRRVSTLPKRRSSFPWFSRANNPNQQHKDCISCMAYYCEDGLLYTGSYDKTVKVWRVSDNRCIDSFVAHDDHVNAVVANQDDGCVFTCSSDGSIKIWRRVYKESYHTLTLTLRFQPSPVNALALSSCSDAGVLYSGSSDGVINFWEKEWMSYRFNHGGFLQGHRFAILCLTSVQRLIFSGSADATIRLWRREEGSCFHECLAVIDGCGGPVKCLAACLEMDKVNVKGYLVYSASLDKSFKVWRVKVLPEEINKAYLDDDNNSEHGSNTNGNRNSNLRIRERELYEMSPVLSPSWVEKRRQSSFSQ